MHAAAFVIRPEVLEPGPRQCPSLVAATMWRVFRSGYGAGRSAQPTGCPRCSCAQDTLLPSGPSTPTYAAPRRSGLRRRHRSRENIFAKPSVRCAPPCFQVRLSSFALIPKAKLLRCMDTALATGAMSSVPWPCVPIGCDRACIDVRSTHNLHQICVGF